MDELKFEWDENKNLLNQKKHGISFDLAMGVFADRNHLELYDDFHSDEEDRYLAIGMVDNVLCVVFTERGEYLRIISARLATKEERNIYYGNC